jgi:hypothetical protein
MNDLISRQQAIDTEGLDVQIRCEMCRNPMHTNRGCDGHCKYDENLYERIIQILDKRITPLPSADPEPSQLAKDIAKILENDQDMRVILKNAETEIVRCMDCKHLQKWRSEESAKKFGQIYECARNVLNCPKPEDFCSRAER